MEHLSNLIEQISLEYGTPLYLYDMEKIRHQYISLRQVLPDSFTIHYALKANSSLSICRLLSILGCAADVSSIGELTCALKSGFSGNKILLTGLSKTDQTMSMAVQERISLIVLESVTEARRLNKIADQFGLKQDVLVRINPLDKTVNGEIAICQGASKFGVEEEYAFVILNEINQLENLNLLGIHAYAESNIIDSKKMIESMRRTILIANKLRVQDLPIEIIDFGGGLGVPYDTSQSPFDLDQFGQELQKLISSNSYQYCYIMEIGRYIVAESGCYICEVMDIKQSRGQKFAILNGGIHQLYRPLMKRANHFLEVLRRNRADKEDVFLNLNSEDNYILVGSLPTPADVLVEDIRIQSLRVGDLVVIYNCGAYSFNHSLANFALHPYPAEVGYENGKAELIRDRGSASYFLLNQRIK